MLIIVFNHQLHLLLYQPQEKKESTQQCSDWFDAQATARLLTNTNSLLNKICPAKHRPYEGSRLHLDS